MDNKDVKVFDRVEGAEEGKICASGNQSMASLYSVDRLLVIYYEAKKEEVSREVKPSLIIEVPALFSYKDNKAVPWKYDANIVCLKTVEPKKKVTGPSQKGKAPMYEGEDDVEIPPEQEVKKAGIRSPFPNCRGIPRWELSWLWEKELERGKA
ncbi:hypothetical protein GOBAR_DD11824 [Gossypium barbadense]|nr:hypothetical protein GOBAR_DD11824 [Gossypium barbadense]